MNYWNKKATPWVSLAVLAGGLFSAGLLFWVSKIESQIQIISTVNF